MPQHRITLTERHYDLVRVFMVQRKLPSARAATERMIELAATEGLEGIGGIINGGTDEIGRRDRRPLLSRSQA